ncbi:MAG: hypothetical protein J6S21_03200, partial [Victivallales bacterium]|nr:hypothetical protein [Victivallales bacterium]
MSHKRIKLSLAALATAFFLAGCAGGSKPVADSDLATGEPRPLPFSQGTLSRQAAPLDTTPLQISELKDDESTAPLRQESLPGRTSSNGGEQGLVSKYPDNLIKGLPDPGTKIKLGLTFNAAELSEVVAAFAAPSMLNFGYIIDPAVKGAVTLAVDTEMTAAQAWETFEHILWLSGAYASMNTGFIHILPFTKMPQERRIFADHEIQPNVVVDFIPIRYKVSANIINELKPFLTEGATATDVVDSNTVVLIEAPANIEKLRELISHLDSKGERDWPCASFQCRDVEADELAAELTQLLPVLGFPVAAGSGSSGGAVKLVALPRIGCVVVSAALPEVVQEVGKWVKALDRSDMMHREEIFFYNSTHTTASKLADAICAFFNAEVSSSSSGLSSGSSSSSGGSFSSGFNSSNRSTSRNRNNSSSRNRSNTGTRSTGSSRNNSNNRRTTTTASNARSTTSTAAR